MRGSLAGGLLAMALTVAACSQPAPVSEQASPREGRGLSEALTPPPPRPPHKPPVPDAEPTLRTPPAEAADALSTATSSAGATSAPAASSTPRAPDAIPAPDQSTAPVVAAPTPPSPPQTSGAEPPPETPRAPPQTASVEPPPPTPLPRLIGLNQGQIRNLLGAPAGREDAAPATIWRYPGRNCDLAIYFYFDLKSQVMRALQYEVDTHGSDEFTGERCFAELVAAHQASTQGATGADTPR